jgi:hypothetical protein
MNHPKFFTRHTIYTTLRCFARLRTNFVALRSHCEAQSGVCLESIQPSIASAPKQSHGSYFAAKSVKRELGI